MGIVWGMPSLIELEGIEENILLCKELGLKFVELNMNMPVYQPNELDIEKMLFLKKKHNIFYTLHLPEDLDVAHFNEDIRKVHLMLVGQSIEVAKKLHIPILNIHMNHGIHFTMPTEKIYLYKKYGSIYDTRIRGFANYIEGLLSGTNIKLAVENTGIFERDDRDESVDVLLKKKEVVLTWDIGHDHSSGNKDEAYIRPKLNKVKHMHFHDAIGKRNHLPLFTGEIDIKDRLNIANKNNCTCVLETKTLQGLRESVNNLFKS